MLNFSQNVIQYLKKVNKNSISPPSLLLFVCSLIGTGIWSSTMFGLIITFDDPISLNPEKNL